MNDTGVHMTILIQAIVQELFQHLCTGVKGRHLLARWVIQFHIPPCCDLVDIPADIALPQKEVRLLALDLIPNFVLLDQAIHRIFRGRREGASIYSVQDEPIPLKAIDMAEYIYKFPGWPNSQGILYLGCPAADDFLWSARISTGKRILLAKLLNLFQLIASHTASSK